MITIIEITEDDVAEGKPYSADACPIAIAATRKLKMPVQVYYSCIMDRMRGQMLINRGGGRYSVIRLETAVARWAEYWDKTRIGRPFSFTVELKEK